MTKEQKIEAYTMLLDGCTLKEIADKFGISRQRISQMFSVQNIRVDMAAESCVYPNIARWMIANKYGFAAIARVCEAPTNSVRYALTKSGSIKKGTIDSILRLTGMTYEEAFFEE